MGKSTRKARRRRSTSPADALFSSTRRRVLGLLFGQPGRSYYATELIGLAASGSGAVQRELARLEHCALVTVRRAGAQKHYQANPGSPLFAELCAIFRKFAGSRARAPRDIAKPRTKLRIPLGGLAGLCRRHGIRRLSLFGPAARGELRPESNIDLLAEFGPQTAPAAREYVAMEAEFCALFEGREVRLAAPSVLDDPRRRESILRDLRVLFEA